MFAVASLIDFVITIFIWILIANAVMSWLVAFNVIDPNNSIVRQIGYFLWRITEPVLAPVRKILPSLGGIDLSPIVVIIALYFIRNLVLVDILGMGRV
jgi:YggT family protein